MQTLLGKVGPLGQVDSCLGTLLAAAWMVPLQQLLPSQPSSLAAGTQTGTRAPPHEGK